MQDFPQFLIGNNCSGLITFSQSLFSTWAVATGDSPVIYWAIWIVFTTLNRHLKTRILAKYNIFSKLMGWFYFYRIPISILDFLIWKNCILVQLRKKTNLLDLYSLQFWDLCTGHISRSDFITFTASLTLHEHIMNFNGKKKQKMKV